MEHLPFILLKIIATCVLIYTLWTIKAEDAWKEIGHLLFIFIIIFIIYVLWNI